MIAHVDVQEHADKVALNTPGGAELMASLGGKDTGLPFFAFLEANGKLIVNSMRPIPGKSTSDNIGHPMAPEEVDWFMVMLKKAVPALSPADARTIETWLRNQKQPTLRQAAPPRS